MTAATTLRVHSVTPCELPVDATLRLAAGTRAVGPGLLATPDPVRLLRLDPSHAAIGALLADRVVPATALGSRTAQRLVASGAADLETRRGELASAAEVRARVTVVVPVHDRPHELDRCLSALGGATDVLVVDDASPEPTVIAAVASRHGARLLRRQVNGGPGAARTSGLAEVTTELVAFVDTDVTVDSGTGGGLRGLVPVLDDPTVAVVAPRIASRPGPSMLARYEVAHSPLDLGPDRATVHPAGRVAYLPSATWLVRRRALPDGFTAGMRVAEDVDAVWRLHAAGWRCVHHPAVVVHHDPRPQLRTAWAQRVSYAAGATPLTVRHPGGAPPLRLTTWTALSMLGVASLSPAGIVLAVVVLTTVTVRLACRLRPLVRGAQGATRSGDGPALGSTRIAAGLVARGLTGTLRAVPRAVARAWPVAIPVLVVAAPRVGSALAAGWLIDVLARRRCRRADPRADTGPGVLLEVTGRLLDDLAYATGLWCGAWRGRTARALWPRSARRVDQPRHVDS